jgi:hypothetical protein
MPHAMQVRQTGGPEVLNWTAVDVGDPGSDPMLQGMTAQALIRQIYTVKVGNLILVHAAAGGTGIFLCQWAAALGATVGLRVTFGLTILTI